MDLFGYGRTAGDPAAFQHERRESRFREVEGRNQSIVAGANDDNSLRSARHQRFQSLRIFFAALSPGAPMMPPPGWVADPHM